MGVRLIAEAIMSTGATATLAALSSLAVATGVALAADPPQLKEGLWSIHSRDVDLPSHKTTEFTSTLCRSHTSDRQTRDKAKDMTDCTTLKESEQGNEYTIESRCKIPGSIAESKSKTLFRGDATHTEVHITYTPALNGVTESTMIQDQKYLGQCPAGSEPGDLLLPNGTLLHLGHAESASQSQP
jgi:hypothetical protein